MSGVVSFACGAVRVAMVLVGKGRPQNLKQNVYLHPLGGCGRPDDDSVLQPDNGPTYLIDQGVVNEASKNVWVAKC